MDNKDNQEELEKSKEDKEESDKDSDMLIIFPPDEYKKYFRSKLEFGADKGEVRELIKRELWVLLIFLIVFTIMVFTTLNFHRAFLAVFGYPVYLIVRYGLWKHRS